MSDMNRKPSYVRGQGLLETIIAIGVIIGGTVGTITLVSSTMTASRGSNDRVVAASLAREAIEVVRNIRDTNWLKIQANKEDDSFNGIFDPATNHHLRTPVFNETSNLWSLADIGMPGADLAMCGTTAGAPNCPADFGFGCTDGVNPWTCSDIYLSPVTVYLQRFNTTPPLQQTIFKRILAINPICRYDSLPENGIPETGDAARETIVTLDGRGCATAKASDGTDTHVMVGIQVLAVVQWQDRGTKQYVLEDRLYNWKYVR